MEEEVKPQESVANPTPETPEPEVVEESKVIMPSSNYKEEDVIETVGSLRITRKYGIAHLPNLNVDAYIPSYNLVSELEKVPKETFVWRSEMNMVKKFVSCVDGAEIPSEDIKQALADYEYTHLRNCIAWVRFTHEMTLEKKSS